MIFGKKKKRGSNPPSVSKGYCIAHLPRAIYLRSYLSTPKLETNIVREWESKF